MGVIEKLKKSLSYVSDNIKDEVSKKLLNLSNEL